MKKSLSTIAIAISALLMAATAAAQPQGHKPEGGPRPERQPQLSVKEAAQQKTDEMNREVCLTEKQYKKVYKLFKKQIQKERDLMEDSMPMGRPEGMPDGFPGGGPGMGGGRPPMGGGQGGPRGGFGGQGGPGGRPEMGSGRPPMGGPGMGADPEELQKLYDKEDKQLRKILTDEQYHRWRATHPKKSVPLPEVQF